MTNAIQFATVYSSRCEGVILADNGATLTVRPWINVTTRWANYTWEVQKRYVRKSIKLSPKQTELLAASEREAA